MSPVPNPNDVLNVAPVSVTKLLPLPTITCPSVGVNPATSSNCASCACTSDPIANPKLVLAPEALEAPVPPSVNGTSVPPALYIMLVCICKSPALTLVRVVSSA